MRRRRRALTPEAKARASRTLVDAILAIASKEDQRIHRVAVYLASPDEIDLAPTIAALLDLGATLVAPRWNGASYDLAHLRGFSSDDLRRGPMGILEPKDPDLVAPDAVDLWLAPGLAFARDGARLGYGGGWYDRFLAAARPDARKLGVAFACQIVDALPAEPHDVRLDGVIVA